MLVYKILHGVTFIVKIIWKFFYYSIVDKSQVCTRPFQTANIIIIITYYAKKPFRIIIIYAIILLLIQLNGNVKCIILMLHFFIHSFITSSSILSRFTSKWTLPKRITYILPEIASLTGN